MGFDLTYKEYNEDTLQAYLASISIEATDLEKKMLESASEEVKEQIVANLNKHRRIIAVRYGNRPAMADDVKTTIKTDTYGDKYAKVMGGKKTGTLWHLVNDGNLHSNPTHFMDNALKKLDKDIDKVWNKAER